MITKVWETCIWNDEDTPWEYVHYYNGVHWHEKCHAKSENGKFGVAGECENNLKNENRNKKTRGEKKL